MRQDQFSLLFVHHEDNQGSVTALKEFNKSEKKLRGYANFLVIGCHNEEFQNDATPFCLNEPDSDTFPLISGFVPPTTRFNPYTKKIEENKEISFANRPKTEKAMSKFVTTNIPNFVNPIAKGKEYDSQIKSNKKINKIVLFSEKSTVPVLFKALA